MSATKEDVSQFDIATGSDRFGINEALQQYRDKVRGGDLGSLPAVLGAVALVILFGVLEGDRFLSNYNFANLLNQGAAITVLAMGLVFVLLLGEIDLSAGFTAGLGAAILAVTLSADKPTDGGFEKFIHGWPWPAALLAALVAGVIIGTLIGLLVARLGIPSFVVTLAAFLALQGALLLIIGETIRVKDETIRGIMNDNMPVWLGWTFALVVIGGYALFTYAHIHTRRKQGLPTASLSVWAAKVGAIGLVLLLLVYQLSQNRALGPTVEIKGVPWVVLLVFVLLVALTFLLNRTAFGRHIYAVGGNAEAARRAGINVKNVVLVCFILGSFLACVAGVLLASRDSSVSPTTGGSLTLLYAVGAAVIGGTSLFGGRGRIQDALMGGIVIAVIANGLPLVTEKSGVQFIVNGLVLLLAASVDAISRKRSAASGRT